MTRLAVVVIAFLGCLSAAQATLAPPKVSAGVGTMSSLALAKELSPEILKAAVAREKEEFQITAKTEVFLDGRPCQYRDVPANADILLLELASDNKAVAKIHFRSRK